MAALTMIDRVLAAGRLPTKDRIELVRERAPRIREIKAPPRGKRIYRLLVYKDLNWELFVAFAGEKKSQKLKQAWIDTAVARVEAALKEGPLS